MAEDKADDIFINFAAAFTIASKGTVYNLAIQCTFNGIVNYILGEVKEGENDTFQGIDTKKEIGDEYEHCDNLLDKVGFDEKNKKICLDFYAKLLMLKRLAGLNDIEVMKIATSLLNTMKILIHM